MLLDIVRKTIEKHALLQHGDTVLCAVSGGADSVCLLHTLLSLRHEYNLTVCVANVNHLIRGEESDRDSEFVKKICKAADVKCYYREYDVIKIAAERRIGEEECGRILRYEFFSEIAQNLNGAKIATAHNLNDNAETVLFRLVRGSSSQGLRGILHKRGNIIRPLLDVTRSEIEKYLYANSLTWCEDSTNKLTIYNRNKLRLCVMPLLNEISCGAERKIVSAAELLADDNDLLQEMAAKVKRESFFEKYLDLPAFARAPVPIKRRVAADVLNEWGVQEVNRDKVESFLEFVLKDSGKQFDINSGFFAQKSYERIYLCPKNVQSTFRDILDLGKDVSDKHWKLSLNVSDVPVRRCGNDVAVFDADKLKLPLNVRYRRDGDKILPKGMPGTKKVSDVFTDAKVARFLRDDIPIVEKELDILYVGGVRQSALYETNSNTKRYLVIKYTKER